MAIYQRLRNKVNRQLSRFQVYHGTVYKRIIEQTGSNALIGKPTAVSRNDSEMFPPPAVVYPRYQGISENNEPYIIGGRAAQIGDIVFIVSVDAISEDEVTNKGFCFVINDGAFEEEFYVIASDRVHVEGKILLYQFLVRSRNRNDTR